MRKHKSASGRYHIGQGRDRFKEQFNVSKNNAPVDLALVLFHTSDAAYLVGDTGNRDAAVWLPMSQVEIDERVLSNEDEERTDRIRGGLRRTGRVYPVHNFAVPEWLATEKRLV